MLKSGLIYFTGRFGAALVTFLTIAAYTRLLSPSGYGVYALVQSGAAIAYAALAQWFVFSLSRFMPEYRDRENVLRTHVAVGFFVMAAVVVAAGPAVLPRLTSAGVSESIAVLGIALFLAMSFCELTLTQFNMLGQPYRYVLYALLRVTVATTAGLVLVAAGMGAAGAIIGLVVGNLAVILSNIRGYWRLAGLRQLKGELFADLARYGIPYAASGALAALINVSDRYLVQWFLGTDAAGLYAAPYDLAMRSLHVLIVVMAMASNPRIFRSWERGDRAETERLILRHGELVMTVTMPVAIVFIMLAPAVSTLLSAEFRAAATQLMPWVAIATVLHGAQMVYLSLVFSLTKQPLRQTLTYAFGAAINVGLNLILIPRFGLLGAAAATVIAYVCIVVASFLAGRRLLTLPFPTKGATKVLLASALFVFILLPALGEGLSFAIVIRVSVASIMYAATLVVCDSVGLRKPFLNAAGSTGRWILGSGFQTRLSQVWRRSRDVVLGRQT
jgi:O-antigen/teichoic acid export membrane protein